MDKPKKLSIPKKTLIANNFLDLSEVEVLEEKYGNDGIVAVIACYLTMTGNATGAMSKEAVLKKGKKHGIKASDLESWFKYIVDENIITEKDGNYINTHTEKDRKSYGIKAEKDRKRKEEEAEEKRKLVYVDDIDLDLNKIILPEKFDTPEMREAVTRWTAKLKTANRKYDQITFEAHMINFCGSAERYIAAVNHSCAMSKTFNLHEPKGEEKKKTTAEKIREMGASLV